MSRIKELSLNNPNWVEKCYLNDLLSPDIQSIMKAMWKKRHKIEKDAKKQTQNRCRYKSFLVDSKMYYSLNIRKTLTPYFIFKQDILFFKNLGLAKLTFSREPKKR